MQISTWKNWLKTPTITLPVTKLLLFYSPSEAFLKAPVSVIRKGLFPNIGFSVFLTSLHTL
jgi:hypothetical protein